MMRRPEADQGFTVIELLVAASLFMALNVLAFGAVLSHAKTTTSVREASDVNEEARVVLNRMTRELREASRVASVVNPGTSGFTGYPAFDPTRNSSLTFEVDFNGNGVIEPDAVDPEEITYAYDAATQQLRLQAGGATVPVLAANVTGLRLTFSSRLVQYDGVASQPKDGIVQWEELDADPERVRGNQNKALDPLELSFMDSVTIDLTMFKGRHKQNYRTQVDLRNRPY